MIRIKMMLHKMIMLWPDRNDYYYCYIFLTLLVWFIHPHSTQSEFTVDVHTVANTVIKDRPSNSTSNFRRPSSSSSSSPDQSSREYETILKDSKRLYTNDHPYVSSIQSSPPLRAQQQAQQQHDGHNNMSIMNMTCEFFEQPLNHFVPRGKSPYYQQRYCYYNEYAKIMTTMEDDDDDEQPPMDSPIFFYTGNESPLEQYINQTGLMWELAPRFRARVVFVEHRYEGRSLPTNLSKDCLSYSSTIQALADYARILQVQLNPNNTAPVIAFGGSYGGMLTAWIRMKYPHLILGGIAASAPIGAFPQSANSKIDWSARVLAYGLDKPYPPTMDRTVPGGTITEQAAVTTPGTNDDEGQTAHPDKTIHHGGREGNTQQVVKNHCRNNLLAAWPLITWMARNESSSTLLQDLFSLCQPLADNNGESLLRWAQSIWFDLAEGSFPYPSSYIPFALLHKKVDLPAWPMQAACWKESKLYKDWGIAFQRSDDSGEDVNYRITYGDSGLTLHVDWDIVNIADDGTTTQSDDAVRSYLSTSKDIVGLLTSVRDAVSIWYNISKDVPCYDISDVAPNTVSRTRLHSQRPKTGRRLSKPLFDTSESSSESKLDPEQVCSETMKHIGSWEPLCCNDEMNLVITDARGMGNDFFWPPSHPREVRTYEDIVRNVTPEPCPDPDGIFGYSKAPYEQWSTWLHTYYGGVQMDGHSNIVFSNGLLDPWSAGGVYEDSDLLFRSLQLKEDRVEIQNITEHDVVALIIPFGGHHTDLMYSSEADPTCVSEARRIEEWFIKKWIKDWQRS